MVKPNVSHCVSENHVHYNPLFNGKILSIQVHNWNNQVGWYRCSFEMILDDATYSLLKEKYFDAENPVRIENRYYISDTEYEVYQSTTLFQEEADNEVSYTWNASDVLPPKPIKVAIAIKDSEGAEYEEISKIEIGDDFEYETWYNA